MSGLVFKVRGDHPILKRVDDVVPGVFVDMLITQLELAGYENVTSEPFDDGDDDVGDKYMVTMQAESHSHGHHGRMYAYGPFSEAKAVTEYSDRLEFYGSQFAVRLSVVVDVCVKCNKKPGRRVAGGTIMCGDCE